MEQIIGERRPEDCPTFVFELPSGVGALVKVDTTSLESLIEHLNRVKFVRCHNGALWSWLNVSYIVSARLPKDNETWRRMPKGIVVPVGALPKNMQ